MMVYKIKIPTCFFFQLHFFKAVEGFKLIKVTVLQEYYDVLFTGYLMTLFLNNIQ